MAPWERPLAHDADGPFAGVPFVVKDLVCHPADVPMRFGSALPGDGVRFPHDTHLMERFRAAGLATVALSTAPELGFNANTEAKVYGSTRNPWAPDRSPGGSSGGSGALVAARAGPIAHANDGGGSIRLPAAYCGLVGLKPSRGRVPIGPDYQEALSGLAVELAVTRSVRDTAAILDAVAGPMPGDKFRIASPERPYRDEVAADPGCLRVAVHTDSWAGSPVDPEVRVAVERVAAKLEAAGYRVEPATPVFDWEAFLASKVTVWCAFLTEAAAGLAAMTGRDPGPDTLERATLACYRHGAGLSVLDRADLRPRLLHPAGKRHRGPGDEPAAGAHGHPAW